MVPEATLDDTETGRVAASKGWFVLNARDARWRTRPGRNSISFTGLTEYEAETYFAQLGVNLLMLEPGVPNAMYHWETEQEAFFVLAGEALLIVEGRDDGWSSGTSCTALPRRATSSSAQVTGRAGSSP